MDSDVPKYRKRGGKHKPYTIECRFQSRSGFSEWHTWRRYSTEKDRDRAYEVLTHKEDFGGYGKGLLEYRKGVD